MQLKLIQQSLNPEFQRFFPFDIQMCAFFNFRSRSNKKKQDKSKTGESKIKANRTQKGMNNALAMRK